MAKKVKYKQPKVVFTEKKVTLQPERREDISLLNNHRERYQKSLKAFREINIGHEREIMSLREQNRLLRAEKEFAENQIKEYESLYKTWEIERRNLVASVEKSTQKLENVKQTKSFRLGYALIFGFKSWQGFKDMWRTLFALYKEHRNAIKKDKISLEFDNTLIKPTKRFLVWESQKPVLQWIEGKGQGFLTYFDVSLFNTNRAQSYLVLDKNGVEITKDCTDFDQLIIKTDIFSEENPDVQKQCLLTVSFNDEQGNNVQPVLNIPYSQRLQKHYFYLNADKSKEDYVFLPIPETAKQVALGLVLWDNKSDIYYNNSVGIAGMFDGISVIIPTYKGEKTITKCLESLARQILAFSEFEVIVVINGEKDNTGDLIKSFQLVVPEMNIKVFELEEGNVSKARNFAIQKATRGWITFIDDDDFVPEGYLSSLYQNATYNTITITGIEDIKNDQVIRSGVMDQLDKAAKKSDLSYFDVTSSLTMNACKLAPSFMVKSVAYDPALRSGEDVVYWSRLLNKFRPKVVLVPQYQEDSYKRLIRDNSVSRKAESYDFNVFQRLEVIKLLIDELNDCQYQQTHSFIQSKIDAQTGFIKRYLQKYPQQYQNCIRDIMRLDLSNCFVNQINAMFTDTLVISYCFAPYIDTSGVVMSKRIRAMNKPVDIITNSMNRVRESDERLLKISEYRLGKYYELNAPQSFANWNAISKFADATLDVVHSMLKERNIHKELYSRAMWPASHIAAALVKIKYPSTKWIAEFSDPILLDVSGKERFEELPIEWLKKHSFVSDNDDLSEKQNLFDWCERLPYLYADELIFTNKNQLEYMLSYADIGLRDVILAKATVLPQPTLNREFYQLSQTKLEKEEGKFHLAYFGSFYVNRGFAPFVKAWQQLPENMKNSLKLYIYTQQDAESILSGIPNELQENIVIQKYVGYFDFLALSDQFDGLIVMDAETKGLKANNPYLPSKLSDYLGSQSKILALVEEGSPMSLIDAPNLITVKQNMVDEIACNLMEFIVSK